MIPAGALINFRKNESSSEIFRSYLESHGVMDKLTKLLGQLYLIPESDRPNPYDWISKNISFLRTDLVEGKVLMDQVNRLKTENEELAEQIAKLNSENGKSKDDKLSMVV